MIRFLLPLGIFALLAVVLAIGIRHAPEIGVVASPLVGKPAPQFSLPSLADASQKISSSELRGRWYIVNFWGTWCYACKEEHSTLLAIRKAALVPLVGFDWRDEPDDARQWLTQLGDPYQSVAVDSDGREAVEWGVMQAPESFLVNPRGIIVYKCTGELTPEIYEREIVPRVTRGVADPRGL